MNRRSFLKGFAGAVGAAIILPPTVGEVAAEVERRYWALDGTMTKRHPWLVDVYEQDFLPDTTGGMTVRMAWAEMGFRVGDMVAITDFAPATIYTPRPNLYTVQKIDWDALSAHDTVTLTKKPMLSDPLSKSWTFDYEKFQELMA